ncbi:MAG: hypothetical protein IKU86_03435, partial [Thermoguttaceae bacterium]|nr:hypothetical protein [Thermoguttaceae bacterium]
NVGGNGALGDETRPVGTLAGANAGTLAVTDGVFLPRYSGDFAQFVRSAPSPQSAETSASSESASTTQSAPIAIPNAAAQTTETLPPLENAQTAETPQTAQAPQGTQTPFLAQFQEASQTAQNAGKSRVDARQTLGNSTFAAGATGTSSSGTLADAGSGATTTRVEATEPKKPESDRLSARENPNAIRISDELRRPSQQGLERGIAVRCAADSLVFPKQPGLRFETTVSLADAPLADVEREVSDAIVLCVKSWGVAGRNMYWAPFLKVKVASGGEERFRELSEFCRTQGLTVVRAD